MISYIFDTVKYLAFAILLGFIFSAFFHLEARADDCKDGAALIHCLIKEQEEQQKRLALRSPTVRKQMFLDALIEEMERATGREVR